jgi:hypothetical protein
MKEVDHQIYQILDENGNPMTFENRVRGFQILDDSRSTRKNFGLMTKEVKSYLLDPMII